MAQLGVRDPWDEWKPSATGYLVMAIRRVTYPLGSLRRSRRGERACRGLRRGHRMLYDRPQETAGEDAMDGPEIGLEGFSPRTHWSRRGFVMTSLVTGFTLPVRPVSAQTMTTDTNGLEAGQSPGQRWHHSRLSGDAGARRTIPDGAGGSGGLWRARAHQGHLPR